MNKVQNGKLYNDVIELVPKGTIFIFYTKSIFIGIWTLIKWLIHVVWSSIYQAKNKNSENPDYYDGYHDKPPSILVDNKIGRHSYVKLKVRYFEHSRRHFFDYISKICHLFTQIDPLTSAK